MEAEETGQNAEMSESTRSVTAKSLSIVGAALQPHMRMSRELHLEESESFVGRFIMRTLLTPMFDYIMGVIILLNMLIMIIELDRNAEDDGGQRGVSWTEVAGWIVLLIFVIELLMRVFAFGRMFWTDAWNVVDFTIVVVDASFSVVGLVVGNAFPISILRIFRLIKLARISKVLRVFPELRVLLACLVGSTRAIFWGIVLLFFVLLVWAMVAVLFIHPMAKTTDFGDCSRCHRAYSSVMGASLTFWQQIVAGDSWGSTSVPIMESNPVSMIFFIPMFMSVGMAVMNLILGVVVNVALTAKEQIETEDNTEKRLFKMEQHTHLLDLCRQMDTARTGKLTRQQVFDKFDADGEFRDRILSMEVTEEDFNIIWTVVDSERKGWVKYTELLKRLYSIRNSDSEFMLAYIKYYITVTRNDLLQEWNELGEKMQMLEEKLEGVGTKPSDTQPELSTWQKLNAAKQRSSSAALQRQGSFRPEDRTNMIDGASIAKMQNELRELVALVKDRSISDSAVSTCKPSSESKVRFDGASFTNTRNGAVAASIAADSGSGVWDKEFSRDIKALQVQLSQMTEDINERLESQVSLVASMNQRISTRPQNASSLGPQAEIVETPSHRTIRSQIFPQELSLELPSTGPQSAESLLLQSSPITVETI